MNRKNRKLKKPNTIPKLVLGHVIGTTTKNANGFDSNELSSKCVYIAGCVVVVCDVDSNLSQLCLTVTNRTPKPLSCVALSNDGRFVAAGELGDQSAVLVWDCINSVFLSELKSHQHGVECIAFSPDGMFLVSIGFSNDGYICLWDWGSGVLVTRLKACPSCSSVESVSFSSDANFIVTAGKKHLKFWKVMSSPKTRAKMEVKSLSMHGKPINLGNHKGSSFVAIKSPIVADNINFGHACETWPVYGLTDAGVLCLISGSKIRKSVDIKVKQAFALSLSKKIIACACNDGVVKLFTTESLDYCGSLMHSESEKCKEKDDSNFDDSKLLPTLPNAIACQFSTSEKLVVVYEDNSIIIWEIRDFRKATSHHVLLSHSGYISDIKSLPCKTMHEPSIACVSRDCSCGTSFATCSDDGTIRLWSLSQSITSVIDQTLVTNSNSKLSKPVTPKYKVSSEIFEPESEKVGVRAPGFHSMAISSDGKYLAVSDITIDPNTEVVVTVGQDKKVNIFSTDTGRLIRSFKQGGDYGEAIKVTVDQSSSFVVCSYSDRSICIYDFLTGEIAARAVGHGEVITGIIFLPDCQHIVSVSGDGCIFVWRLPTLMSTKMLHKNKEISHSLLLSGNLQPHIENAHQFKIIPEEIKQTESSTPVTCRFSCQEGHEVSVFKFSISRLPKWAQARAVNPVVDPGHNPSQENGNSSSVGSHDCLDIQTPSKLELSRGELLSDSISWFSPDTNTSKGSRLAQKTNRMSFAMDGRWLTIHTVCLDLLASPGVCDMKAMVNSPRFANQDQADTVEGFKQTNIDINSSCIKHQNKEMLNHNLSNLAARSKTQKRSLQAKGSALTRFALQQDFKGQENSSDSPIRIPTGEHLIQVYETKTHALLPNSPNPIWWVQQELQNLEPNRCLQNKMAECSTMNHQNINSKHCEEHNTIITCEEALLKMETAVDSAFYLFSQLRNLDIRGDWRESRAGLYSQAAELLPSISMKIHALTKMVECSKIPYGKTEDDILTLC